MIKARSIRFLAACGTAAVVLAVLFNIMIYAQQDDVLQIGRHLNSVAADRIEADSFDNGNEKFIDAKNQSVDLQKRSNRLNNQLDNIDYPPSRVVKKLSDIRISQKLNEFRQELKNATSTEQKDQAKKSVREALFEYFDADMNQRHAELEKLTARIEKMSAALKKRTAAKEQLVDLQLKSFKYEADGLGLFSKQRANSRSATELGTSPPLPVYAFTLEPRSFSAPKTGMGGGFGAIRMEVKPDPLKEAMSIVNKARQKVRSAKPEEDRTKAMTELRKALSEYFDVDLKTRQQELDSIHAGLKKMQAGLQKRTNAKEDIVDLQLQIIVNEAEGLGFFREATLNSDDILRGTGLRSGAFPRY